MISWSPLCSVMALSFFYFPKKSKEQNKIKKSKKLFYQNEFFRKNPFAARCAIRQELEEGHSALSRSTKKFLLFINGEFFLEMYS